MGVLNHIRLRIRVETYITDFVIPNSYGVELRSDMPQILGDSHEDFLKFLEDNEIGFILSDNNSRPETLKATQNEFNVDKILTISKKLENAEDLVGTPIISTNDGYVLDGHHRWIAYLSMGMTLPSLIRVDMGIEDLLDKVKDFVGVEYDD